MQTPQKGRFYNLKDRSPGVEGGYVISKGIVTELFNYAEQNVYFKILIEGLSGKRGGGGKGASSPPIFLVTKFFFLILDILGLLVLCNQPWKKK
jgi:hypothetical protein